jgi:hypothetical protein
MAINRELFTKLMQMTESSNDGEALTAIRKANVMLKEHGHNWETFVNNRIIVATQQKPNQHRAQTEMFDDAKTIDPMFDELLRKHPKNRFVQSVFDFWERNHFISGRQFNALEKMLDE